MAPDVGWYILNGPTMRVVEFKDACSPLLSRVLRPFLGTSILKAHAFYWYYGQCGWQTLWLTEKGVYALGHIPPAVIAGPFITLLDAHNWLNGYHKPLPWKLKGNL